MSRRPPTHFDVFDPTREVGYKKRNLPHWFQPNTATFVTYRTGDSIPGEVLENMRTKLARWLRARKLPPDLAETAWSGRDNRLDLGPSLSKLPGLLQPKLAEQFKQLKNRLFARSLDDCHGACHLRREELREIVCESLFFYEQQRYSLDSFVVMPNHVHVLVQFYSDSDWSVIGQSWMRYPARRINKVLLTAGEFWQGEAFDHLIRSEDQFLRTRDYILNNPLKAKLKPSDYSLWQSPSSFALPPTQR